MSAPAPRTAPPPVEPPGAAVRGERIFVRVDRALAWLDGVLARWIPHEHNPLTRAGAAANLALIVAVVSGVAMLVWYSPSTHYAYPSLEALRGTTLGGFVRALHRYSSDLAMVLLFIHAGRTFFARKFAGVRWLPWLTGVLMLGLVWLIGWTGYWLVWDQPAKEIAVSSMRLLDALPIFGEPIGRLYVADRLVPSLLFFVIFFLHMLLPLGIAIGLALHLTRVSRAKLMPTRMATIALVGGMVIASILVPAPLDEPASMAEKATHFTVDAWYMTPLALGLRFQHAGLWVTLIGTSALAASLPWLLGRRRPAERVVAEVDVSHCHSCMQCTRDCPFDAITLVPRTDGRPFPSQAQVDPASCVGCGVCTGSCDSDGISIMWFSPRHVQERLREEIIAARAAGGTDCVALVCGEIDGGMDHFERARWQARLPGFHVQVVPTSSWVQPKLVETILREGTRVLLIVRDARTEAWSRDGSRWILDRLAEKREPHFRPKLAGTGVWHVTDFDPSAPDALTATANALRDGVAPPMVTRKPRPLRIAAAVSVIAVVLGVATVAPSHLRVANPAPTDPEFVFSFKAFGDFTVADALDPAKEAALPIHMRGRSTAKPERGAVRVRLTIDDAVHERSYTAKGISNDGPAIGEWREVISEGWHTISIAVHTGEATPPVVWTGEWDATPRRVHVVTFEPDAGFRVE